MATKINPKAIDWTQFDPRDIETIAFAVVDFLATKYGTEVTLAEILQVRAFQKSVQAD